MKKSILVLALALMTSLIASAQSENSVEGAKVVHRLFQKLFQPSCTALPELAICDFNLQNEIVVLDTNSADHATLSMTTLQTPAAVIAAKDLVEKYRFDYMTSLRSTSVLESWVKRLQSHGNETSRAEYEAVYFSALGVNRQDVMQLEKAEDDKKFHALLLAVAAKFNASERDAKFFLEDLIANEPTK